MDLCQRLGLAAIALLVLLTACTASDARAATDCGDGTERYECTDQWMTDLALHLGMRDPAEIRGDGDVGDQRTTQEQLNAAAEFQRFSLAMSRADQACQLRQGVAISGEALVIPPEIEQWVATNLCPER